MEEAAVAHDVAVPPPHDHTLSLSPAAIAKGKRTKRQRLHSPVSFTISPPPDYNAATSEESTTTDEVDTARCLILLSQGHNLPTPPPNDVVHFPSHSQYDDVHLIPPNPKKYTAVSGGACVYTCKTCNRSFPSFQALGGHRASHKKPKNEKRSAAAFSDEEDFPSPSLSSSKHRFSSNSLSLQLSSAVYATAFTPKSSPSPRMHECAYCGAEFTSGQALGGHMRKHRGGAMNGRPISIVPAEPSIEEAELEQSKRPKNGLSLDLNLPAPDDENQRLIGVGSGHDKGPKEKEEPTTGLGLSTTTPPPLIDCHY